MLTIRQAQQKIDFFNKKTQYPADDAVIALAFSVDLNPLSHLARVALLDALFATNLARSKPPSGRQRKSLAEISESIRASLEHIRPRLQSLDSQNLMMLNVQHQRVQSVIRSVTETLVSCCNNRAFSFATKYLHFLKPALFAPWDSVAPKGAKCLLPELTEESKGVSDKYIELLVVHKHLWSGFSEKEQRALLKYDFETQPKKWRRLNTPVRVVDKILWVTGKSKRDCL